MLFCLAPTCAAYGPFGPARRGPHRPGGRWLRGRGDASIILVTRRPSVLGEQAVHHAQRLRDQVSDNRHGRRRTPADIHGRSVPGQACCDAGSPGRYLASDEEAAGSNPGHPDHKSAGHTASDYLRFAFRLSRCPILGAKGERTGLLAGRIPASSRLSSCTADTGDSAAR